MTNEQEDLFQREVLSEQRLANLKQYVETTYEARVHSPKPPSKEDLSFWRLVGLKATFFTISAIGGIFSSGIRTGGYFFIVEKTFLSRYLGQSNPVIPLLAFLSMVATIIGFEGYGMADGFEKGEKMKDIQSSNWGIVIVASVMGVIGLFSGLEIAEFGDGYNIFSTTIAAVVSSLGLIALPFLGGRNIGFSVAEFFRKKKELLDDHQKEYDNWYEKAVASFFAMERAIQKKVQKTDENQVQEPTDYRTWRKSATHQQVEWLANATTQEIMAEFNLEDRTALNWKKYARKELGLVD